MLQIIRLEHSHEMVNSPDSQYFATTVGQFKNFEMQFNLGILFQGRCVMPSLILEVM